VPDNDCDSDSSSNDAFCQAKPNNTAQEKKTLLDETFSVTYAL